MRVHKSTATMQTTIHQNQPKLYTYFDCPHSCGRFLSFATFVSVSYCFHTTTSSYSCFYHHGVMTVTTDFRINRCCGRHRGRRECRWRRQWQQGGERSLVVVVHPCLKFFTRIASIDGTIFSMPEHAACLWCWWWWRRRWRRGRRLWLYPNKKNEKK